MKQKDFFNSIAANWDGTRESNHEKLQLLVQKLGLNQEDQILDLGSGTGVLLPYLASLVHSVTAVDFAENMLAISQEKHKQFNNITYLVADVEALPWAESSFHHIVCLNFFPHVARKEKFMEDMYKLLKVGGKLTIMHDISRQAVNGIHGSCEQVQEDRLPPAAQTAQLLLQYNFTILVQEENEHFYFVQGRK